MILAENPACNPSCRVCHYKHLDYETQLTRKQTWASTCLSPWKDVLREMIPAPAGERMAYRAKSWMRSSFADGVLSFGMIRAARVDGEWGKEFISWDHCPLHLRPIQEVISRLRHALASEAPSFSEKSLHGVWFGSSDLVIVSRLGIYPELLSMDWSPILSSPFSRVWLHQTPQVGKKVFGAGEILQVWGRPSNTIHPIRAFRQVAGSLLGEARTAAVRALMEEKPEMVLDLYCGTGELASLIPAEVGWLGIEHSKEAVLHAWSLGEGRSAFHEAYEGAVERRLCDPRVLGKIPSSYALYLNPPRPGLGEEGREQLRTLIRGKYPHSIVYLSCSASSLARDLQSLCKEGFQVESLQPYDFFPQTEHFETLAILKRTE